MIVRREDLDFRALPGRSSADPFAGRAGLDFAMRIVVVEPGARNPHLHPRSFEAIYVIEGEGHLWEGGRRHPIRPGDCIAVPPGTPHATLADRGETVRLACFFADPDLAGNIDELQGTIADDQGGGTT